MLDQDKIDRLFDNDLYSSDGERVGRIRQVYADDDSGSPQWLTVGTGLFGTKETFVPLAGAEIRNAAINVPYTRAFIKDAPNVEPEAHLSAAEERQLFEYYSRSDYDTEPRDEPRARLRRYAAPETGTRTNPETGTQLDPGTEPPLDR